MVYLTDFIPTICRSPVIQFFNKKLFKPADEFRNQNAFFIRFPLWVCSGCQLIHKATGRPFLAKFVTVLKAIPVNYFFDFLTIPYEIAYPRTRRVIDDVEESIHMFLKGQSINLDTKEKIELREQISTAIEEMIDQCHQVENRNNDLEARLRSIKCTNLSAYSLSKAINLDARPITFFEHLQNLTFYFVSIASVPAFLHHFKLIDLARIARFIGAPNFTEEKLETSIRLACCLAYGFKFVEACRRLSDEKKRLSEPEKKNLRLDIVSTVADICYQTICLKLDAVSQTFNIRPKVIRLLAMHAAHGIYCLTTIVKYRNS
jgi:hypothetical protein